LGCSLTSAADDIFSRKVTIRLSHQAIRESRPNRAVDGFKT
jgi:hypothetical protein